MEILLVNDDGYKAKGLRVLADAMAKVGNVTVVAPKKPQSAMATSVSLGLRRLAAKRLPELGPGKWFYLDATPVSCVKYALNFPMYEDRPDVVISGINHGSNASTGSCYSATLGAAEEGAINGIPSIGVSLDSFIADPDFEVVTSFFPEILKTLLENWPKDAFGLFYNINFPDCRPEDVKGVRVTRMGRGHWIKEFRLCYSEAGMSVIADLHGNYLPPEKMQTAFSLQFGQIPYTLKSITSGRSGKPRPCCCLRCALPWKPWSGIRQKRRAS